MHHADAMTTPLLYAELLPNLQQVNVFIELHSPAIQATTSLCLSASGTLLTLHHELGENHESDISLPLPSPVKPPPPPPTVTNTQALTVIPGSKSWSRAFSLLSGKTFAPPEPDVNQVPWSAPELVSLNPGFNCAHCHAELLRPGKIKTWKDLPNHNWAEMMDFWHCHKPHEKGDTEKDKAATKRTNKANGRGIGGFAAEEGVGLVDLTFLLLNSRDVVGIEIVESEKNKNNAVTQSTSGDKSPALPGKLRTIYCTTCKTSLGYGEDLDNTSPLPSPDTNDIEETLRLNKWLLCILSLPSPPLPPSPASPCKVEKYPPIPFLSAQIITMISDLASNRFRLVAETEKDQIANPKIGLRVWILHIDRMYSYASLGRITGPLRGMKVLYLENGPPAGEVAGNGKTTEVAEEDIVIPKELLEEARVSLRKSTEGMPVEMREFRGWKSGVLERFKKSRLES